VGRNDRLNLAQLLIWNRILLILVDLKAISHKSK
jgi:hypothetical protein